MSPEALVALIEIVARARRRSPATIARLAAGTDGRTYGRLRGGCDITLRRATRITQWLSDHWPATAEWPADIPRPTPRAGAAASQPAAPATAASPREAVRAARERRDTASAAGDWDAVQRWQGAAVAAAMKLGDHGRIADPTALCEALAVRRYVYDDAVRRYAGRPDRRPRPGRPTARVVEALRAAGDVRFIHSREAA